MGGSGAGPQRPLFPPGEEGRESETLRFSFIFTSVRCRFDAFRDDRRDGPAAESSSA